MFQITSKIRVERNGWLPGVTPRPFSEEGSYENTVLGLVPGDPCCATDAESLEKTHANTHNVAFARTW